MNGVLTNLVSRLASLSWLAGPIFEKELRVSSRRKRSYFLRFAYVAAMTFFVTFAWLAAVNIGSSASPAFRASRMGEAGKYIVTTIIWFQFISAQIIAVVMLSTAISSEIYGRTLGLLMTTPVSSFQIVIGKLLSKLLQVMLLLAVSLPLLAVVRVFGGVPWDYVVSSLCVTFTAAVFAGSVSLLFSITSRKAHEVVIATVAVCFLIYSILPAVAGLLQFASRPNQLTHFLLTLINPFVVMFLSTERLINPRAGGPASFWFWHCVAMLGASALCLALSTLSARKAALRQATGEAGLFLKRKERRLAEKKALADPSRRTTTGAVRPVVGPPLVWKEIRTAFTIARPLRTILGYSIAGICLLAAYGFFAYTKYLAEKEVQIGFVLAYFFLGLLRTATVSASSITSEKEARTWPILLTTPLDQRQIALQKTIASTIRAWPFWLLLGAHLTTFTLLGFIHPVAVLPLVVLVITSALLVSAVGVFFSSCFKRTSTAATFSLISLFVLSFPLPAFIISPFFVATMIMTVGAGNFDAGVPFYELQYGFFPGMKGFLVSAFILTGIMVIYLLIAFLFYAFAVGNVRRNIF
ncbi:MAG: ABC transporter permease subunit [Planctomycetota bacterium]|jgi:ABC-type transport system involved in multi-copper enzyme maturation permease subunit